MIVRVFRRHGRWADSANAYIDDELSPCELARFERHLRGCGRCKTAVAAARETKALLAAMPAVRAPRSFALTPAMLAEPVVRQPVRGQPIALRLAQAATAIAVVGLATVVSIDLTSGGSGPAQPLAASQESVAGRVSGTAATPAHTPTVAPSPESASPAPTTTVPVAPPPVSGVGAQGLSPSVSPAVSATAAPSAPATAAASPGAKGVATGGATFGAHDTAGGAKHAAPGTRPREASTTAGWYRPTEIGLGAAAIVAGVAAFVLAVRRRRT